jgi:hypothetical protein
MGEAKRRKLLDPNYGKPIPITFQKANSDDVERFRVESMELVGETGLKPDFGLWQLMTFGVKPIHQVLVPDWFIVGQEKSPINGQIYENICISVSGMIATIFLTRETFAEWKKEKAVNKTLLLIPCIQDRYLNPQKNDWVIPLYEFREGIDSIAA